MELNLEKFSPAKAELHSLAEKAKLITKESSQDEVHKMRAELRSTRTSITKTGKAMRDDAIKFQKAVIEKEKELVAIIEPEENRIAGIEEQIEVERQREERRELLPNRVSRILRIDDDQDIPLDDVLLNMDSTQFEEYLNERVAAKNKREQEEIDAEKRKLAEEQEKLAREKEMREREERARQEERERLAREQKEKEEREAREKKEAETRAQREKENAERKAKEDQERLESEGRYQAFLKEHGYTPETADNFVLARSESEAKLYKLVGVFKIK